MHIVRNSMLAIVLAIPMVALYNCVSHAETVTIRYHNCESKCQATYDCHVGDGNTFQNTNINCGHDNGNGNEKKNNEIGTLDKPMVTEEVGKMTSFINGIKKVFSDIEKAIIDTFNTVLRLK